jgi:hypothetical protein
MHIRVAGRRALLFLPFLVLAWVGCRSHPATPSSRLASVLITNHPVMQVETATEEVFTQHGYQTGRSKTSRLVFEKEGTGMNTLVYGDWSTKKVWVRVKVYVHDLTSVQQVLLECDAFMVAEHGDPHFEEEHKLTGVHRGRFQDLLDEVSQRLK